MPGASKPTMSRPRLSAPARVAACTVPSTVVLPAPCTARWISQAMRASPSMSQASLQEGPSTPRDTRTPAACAAGTGAMPLPRRALLVGQWAMPVPLAASSAISPTLRCTMWASHTSSPSQPWSAMNCTGRQPYFSRV